LDILYINDKSLGLMKTLCPMLVNAAFTVRCPRAHQIELDKHPTYLWAICWRLEKCFVYLSP